MARRLVFAVDTPLGYRVVLTRNRWREIVRYKHPALAGHEKPVRHCIEEPDVIRAAPRMPRSTCTTRLMSAVTCARLWATKTQRSDLS